MRKISTFFVVVFAVALMTKTTFAQQVFPNVNKDSLGWVNIVSPNDTTLTISAGSQVKIKWECSKNFDIMHIGYSFGPGSLNWIGYGIPVSHGKGEYAWTIFNESHTLPTKVKIIIFAGQTGVGTHIVESEYFTVSEPQKE